MEDGRLRRTRFVALAVVPTIALPAVVARAHPDPKGFPRSGVYEVSVDEIDLITTEKPPGYERPDGTLGLNVFVVTTTRATGHDANVAVIGPKTYKIKDPSYTARGRLVYRHADCTPRESVEMEVEIALVPKGTRVPKALARPGIVARADAQAEVLSDMIDNFLARKGVVKLGKREVRLENRGRSVHDFVGGKRKGWEPFVTLRYQYAVQKR